VEGGCGREGRGRGSGREPYHFKRSTRVEVRGWVRKRGCVKAKEEKGGVCAQASRWVHVLCTADIARVGGKRITKKKKGTYAQGVKQKGPMLKGKGG